tara:strand:- start:251 stop:400 length:150 start_codon:yes stop_codon:yes gene_type:complete
MKLSSSDYWEYFDFIYQDIDESTQGYLTTDELHIETELELKKQNITLKR